MAQNTGAIAPMRLKTALTLGRVSNLPTVWTNTLAGVVIAGGAFGPSRAGTAAIVEMLVAFSLFYVGGMFLNDAFDAEFDAKHRPQRPIPAGEIARRTVFAYGYAMLAAGIALLLAVGLAQGVGVWPAAYGLALAVTIVAYDRHHKANPLSPLVMGLCRVWVYVAAASCITVVLPRELWVAAALLLCYLIGLTYVAKQETLGRVENLWPLAFLAAPVIYGAWAIGGDAAVLPYWLLFAGCIAVALGLLVRRARGDIPRAVVTLIAGISLLDAMLIASAGATGLAMLGVAGFALTLLLQRVVSGT